MTHVFNVSLSSEIFSIRQLVVSNKILQWIASRAISIFQNFPQPAIIGHAKVSSDDSILVRKSKMPSKCILTLSQIFRTAIEKWSVTLWRLHLQCCIWTPWYSCFPFSFFATSLINLEKCVRTVPSLSRALSGSKTSF